MFASETFRELSGWSRLVSRYWRAWGRPAIAVALVAAGALMFDAVTPQIISVGIFYVGIVLIGFWFPAPKAALVLALLATLLSSWDIWITLPDKASPWQAWMNRALATGTVWMAAVFVWHIRVLDQKLREQIEIANGSRTGS